MPTKLATLLTVAFFLFNSSELSSQNIGKNKGVSPHIIAIGGGADEKILPIFIKEAGGPRAKILIISAARKTLEQQTETALAYKKDFVELGVPAHQIYFVPILSREDANNIDKHYFSLLNGLTAVFVSGGNQKLLLDRIYKTKLHQILVDKTAAGVLYCGTSAGTAWLGPLCITRSDSVANAIEVLPGLGLVDLVLEQHYSQRKRQWRLEKLLKEHSELNGFGIDESTALIFDGNKKYLVNEEGEAHDLTTIEGLVRQDH